MAPANPAASGSLRKAIEADLPLTREWTNEKFRRLGYATAAVAALSEALLKTGGRFCCLYTDLVNPTSNSIYAKIGYRPIRDDAEVAFEA